MNKLLWNAVIGYVMLMGILLFVASAAHIDDKGYRFCRQYLIVLAEDENDFGYPDLSVIQSCQKYLGLEIIELKK